MTRKEALERIIKSHHVAMAMLCEGRKDDETEKAIEIIKHDLNRLEKLEEKEIPIKPIANHYEEAGEKPYIKYSCPKCNSKHQLMKNYGEYCPHCGQRLDWSECNE